MSNRRARRPLQALLVAATVTALFGAFSPAAAAPWAGNRNAFAAPRFEAVWRSADLPVQQGQTGRSWTWGPMPWFDYNEPYKQSPNGLRQVQYFDKARMEINDPANTSGPLGGVTNGLLVVEMVSGRIKLGNGIDLNENRQWRESDIPVAGDPPASGNVNPNTPTYASFRGVATTDNGYRDPNKVGQRVATTLGRDGSRGVRQDLAALPGADIVNYEPATGHNIPRVFDEFRGSGPVPWIAAFGYPISDPYWITARVGGQDKDVMVQLFERRALTYTPSNPAAFRVEMGNVGQHYFQWRYGRLGEPWNNPDPRNLPIVFASKRDYPEFTTYIMDQNGANQRLGHTGWGRSIPYSFVGYYHPFQQIPTSYGYTASTSPDEHNGRRRLASWQAEDARTSFYSESRFNDWDPAISPDGNQIIFASDRDGNADLYLVTLPIYSHNGSNGAAGEARLNISPVTQTTGCSNTHPSWLPDGSGIVYESTCEGGKSQIYRAALSYTVGPDAAVRIAQPTPGRRLTSTGTDEYWPRVSPDGSRIAFFSNRDGNTEVYTMNIDGGDHRRLTNNAARDEGPVWSPDGAKLAFNSNRDGDHEIFVMNADGGGQTQLTNNTVDDGYAVWGP